MRRLAFIVNEGDKPPRRRRVKLRIEHHLSEGHGRLRQTLAMPAVQGRTAHAEPPTHVCERFTRCRAFVNVLAKGYCVSFLCHAPSVSRCRDDSQGLSGRNVSFPLSKKVLVLSQYWPLR